MGFSSQNLIHKAWLHIPVVKLLGWLDLKQIVLFTDGYGLYFGSEFFVSVAFDHVFSFPSEKVCRMRCLFPIII